MDGNLAMANSLENGAEPADIFEYEYGFNKRQAVALESLYMDESLAGRYQTIHDFAKRAQRLLLTDESSGLHKHVVTTRYLVEAVQDNLIFDRAFITKEELIEGYKRLYKMNFPDCSVCVTILNGW